jgi:hypothetical protein
MSASFIYNLCFTKNNQQMASVFPTVSPLFFFNH